ncbi:FmdB family zinc ribbon protein [Variovorax sp. LG9.2]|jgi:putative FmdB family regulatory protein|uniref:FmdB family zinc ribbon protein n=1 Tax=Variovorax sp. LG9.2 TaxID=3048626 RepID=UPI002B22B597|nr:FmdB family zinc ribbon protein [Variovorax sp. LG9.2]MEB0056131.1 zinc ribbon domain-containing protein [Variovorax sp. LG9.2]
MPIYAYKCSSCGFAKDSLQKMSDAPLTVCPNCGKSTFEKQVTAAGFQLKGSGWYVTDFREGGGKKPADKSDKPGDTPDQKSDAKSAEPASGSADAPAASPAAPAASPAPAVASTPAAAPPSPKPAAKGD